MNATPRPHRVARSPMRAIGGALSLSLGLPACSASPPTVVTLQGSGVPGETAPPAEPLGLSLDTLSPPMPDPAHNPGRGKSSIALCESLFFQGASAWIQAKLPRAAGGPFDTYCDPLRSAKLAVPMLRAAEDTRQEERDAAERIARRDTAVRSLEQDAASPDAPAVVLLALGYLLAERAYEDARTASWQCNFCELGPPNAWNQEAFFTSLRGSSDFQRAIGLFDKAAVRPEGAGWMAGVFALRTRREVGRSDVKDIKARLATGTPPPGARDAVLWLARTALEDLHPDLARDFFHHLEAANDAPQGARLWLFALGQRWDDTLRVASEILANRPLSLARDALALGVLAAEHVGMDTAHGARDGQARIALSLADRAFAARDIAGAWRWLDWIRDHAGEAALAPAVLETLARLADAQGEHDMAARARAAIAADANPLGVNMRDMAILLARMDDATLRAARRMLDGKR
jgi:hypothetical protein